MKNIIRAVGLVLGITTVVALANAQTVKVNWRRNAPFSDLKTYAWKFSPKEQNSFYKQFTRQYVDEDLQKRGLQKVSMSQKPDIVVTYHFMTQDVMDATTTSDGFGFGGGPWGGWGGWGGWDGGMGMGDMGVSNTEDIPRTMGILTLDMARASNKELIWRGQATEDNISNSQKGDEKQVKKSVDKMLEHFPPKEK